MNWTSISTVAFVCILIISLATCYTTIYLPALYRHNATTFWLLTPSCLIPLIIGCYCYMKAVWISPGYTPANSEMRSRSEQQKQYKHLMKLKKITPEIRRREIRNLVVDSYCEKCSDIKPSRTHHCKICKRCITRMDHHCPWVGNCIGKHNHKFFFLFLLYMTITLLIVSVSIFADFINPQQPLLTLINQSDEMYLILTLLTGGMCVMLMFSVGFLLISQFLLLLNNLTTLESFYEGIYQHNPFEKETFRENAKDIMGDSWWFLPTEPFPGERKETNVAFTE